MDAVALQNRWMAVKGFLSGRTMPRLGVWWERRFHFAFQIYRSMHIGRTVFVTVILRLSPQRPFARHWHYRSQLLCLGYWCIELKVRTKCKSFLCKQLLELHTLYCERSCFHLMNRAKLHWQEEKCREMDSTRCTTRRSYLTWVCTICRVHSKIFSRKS